MSILDFRNVAASDCKCFFCQEGKVHPKSHTTFGEMTGRLLVAESLLPEDRVRRFGCSTCGHTVEEVKV